MYQHIEDQLVKASAALPYQHHQAAAADGHCQGPNFLRLYQSKSQQLQYHHQQSAVAAADIPAETTEWSTSKGAKHYMMAC